MDNKPKPVEYNKIDAYCESIILRALIAQPEFLEHKDIKESLFNFNRTKNIFNTINELVDRKEELNRQNLIVCYLNKGLDQSENDIDEILSINWEKVESIQEQVNQLIDHNKKRHAIKLLNDSIDKIKEQTILTNFDAIKDIKDLISEAESTISGVQTSVDTVYTMPMWTDEYIEKTKSRRNGKQFIFNNFILDYLISDGPTPGDFGTITSRSGAGKSTLCLNIVNNLIETDIPVMYFSLEMGGIATMDRLLAMRMEIDYSEIAHPKDSDSYDAISQRIKQEKEDLDKHNKFRFCESPSLSLNDIKKEIKKFQADIGQTYCIVIIDLISMVQDFVRSVAGQNSAFTIEVGVNKWSAICKELGIHGIGVVQLNRGADEKVNDLEDIKKLRPTINQIKNAKAWEERSRWIIGTHRDKHYADQFLKEITDEIDDIMEVMVLKQNSGALGRCNALFMGSQFRITPIENKEETSDVQ